VPPTGQVTDIDITSADSKKKVRFWFEETVRGGTSAERLCEVGEKIISPSFVDHHDPDPEHRRDAFMPAVSGLLRAPPDARFTVEKLIGGGDLVAVGVRGEGTHTGEVMGIAHTGKRISLTESENFRFVDGRIIEGWGEGGLDEALAEIGFGFRAKRELATLHMGRAGELPLFRDTEMIRECRVGPLYANGGPSMLDE